MKPAAPITRRIVLIGGGHSHVTVLRSFGMMGEPGTGLTLIAKEIDAPYSGMLPGFVAGHYTHQECHIDLVRLAAFAGARLIHGEATGIDRAARRVHIAGRPPITYDQLSIDTGITPDLTGIEGAAEHAIAVKPVSTFAPRWQALEARALQKFGPRRLAVVGTGAAGFELVLAIHHRLRAQAKAAGLDPDAFACTLIGSDIVLPSHNARARAYAYEALAAGGIGLIEKDAVIAIAKDEVALGSGRRVKADAVLVTTKAAPPAWFAKSDLPRDAKGFLAVRPTLQVLDDDDVFAVGDCATIIEHPREKAGVFAVRQGPPLTQNLRRRARGETAEPFTPQRQFLTLLSLGDKRAIASRGRFAARGGWVWTWKDRIDREFMTRFNEAPFPAEVMGETEALRCGGCAAKIGPATLSAALSQLPPAPSGLAVRDETPNDDAAVLDLCSGDKQLRLETVDFFRAFWAEPYLLGEIAANHALGDIYAMGGAPDHALAIAQLPYGSRHLTEDDLTQLMAGARATLDREGVALVGGHSSEGAELSVGFFVSGKAGRARLLTKRGLATGQSLILTKPIGTGILFAAAMRGKARAPWIEQALASMRLSSAKAAAILREHGATAATDVTGFGLAGHIIEMLEASSVSAELWSSRIAVLPGAAELAEAGLGSTLLPENLALADRIETATRPGPRLLALLFDPQTAGGLVAGVPPDQEQACVAALRAAGYAHAAAIGRVQPPSANGASILRFTDLRASAGSTLPEMLLTN